MGSGEGKRGVTLCRQEEVFVQKTSAAGKGDTSMISREQLADLQEYVGEWVREHIGTADLDGAEAAADEIARACGAATVKALVPSTAGKKSHRGTRLACRCGGELLFESYRERSVGTLYTVIRVKRAYYRCRECGYTRLPWDEEQGLDSRLWTPRVKAVVAMVATQVSYQTAVDLLMRLLGFKIEDSSADEVVAEVGQRLRSHEAALISGYASGELTPLVSAPPGRLYVGMDGTSAHIEGAWHEVKTGVVFEGKPDSDGIDTACESRYVAAQESSEQFGHRLYALAAEAGVELAREVVVIGDGAEWIWNLADHHYPRATQIVDYWHACEHIHELARIYYGENNSQGRRWARKHCHALKHKGPHTLLRALNCMEPKTPEQAEAVRLARGYFEHNRERMAYDRFRTAGLMIGSGPVEAACKVVVGQRLKGAGMRWSADGSDAILAARAAMLSKRTDLIEKAARAA